MRIFKEEQRFRQAWLIILLAISILIPIGLIVKEYTAKESTMSSSELIYTILLLLVFSTPIFFFKLKTRIDEKGIHYRFFPFHRSFKTILWVEINNISIRKYDPISEYGGWGLKGGFRRKKGKAINVSGDIGIQIELKNTKKLLIGTQKKHEAKRTLDYYQDKIKIQ
ncbi:MAG: hypothetical protein JXQ93_05625 [Flavobacteriaceae bacterium]